MIELNSTDQATNRLDWNKMQEFSNGRFETVVVRMEGGLEYQELIESLQDIVAREAQAISTGQDASASRVEGTFEDLRNLAKAEQTKQVRQVVERSSQPLVFQHKSPLLRVDCLHVADSEHLLVLTRGKFWVGAPSGLSLLQEVAALYQERVTSDEPERTAAAWEQKAFETDPATLAYWREQLQGAPIRIELPTDRQRRAVESLAVERLHFTLSQDVVRGLRRLSDSQQVEMSTLLASAFATLLHRYNRQDDIVLGMGLEKDIPVRVDFSEDIAFSDVAEQVEKGVKAGVQQGPVLLRQLAEEVGLEPDMHGHPIYQVAFEWQEDKAIALERADSRWQLEDASVLFSALDLKLQVGKQAEGVTGWLAYRKELFAEDTVQRMMDQFFVLLSSVVADPSRSIRTLPLLSEQERKQMMVNFNETASEYPTQALIHQLFEAQAEKTADAVAVVAGAAQLSYRELNVRANQVASLLREHGVGPDVRVGLLMERTTDMIVAMLAILKAGGAYVPLDPKYPEERVALMLEDSQVKVLITQEKFAGQRVLAPEAVLVLMDADREQISQRPSDNLETVSQPHHLAYVIYTSGSTGRPKGVAIEHRNTNAFIHWALDVFSKDVLQGVLAGTSVCFDLSVFEIFVTLSGGGRIILVDNALHLADLDDQDGVTLLNTVPSVAAELIRLNGIPKTVRTVNLAGEALSKKLVQKLYAIQSIEAVYNLYGPTEDTTYSTYTLVDKESEEIPTIGRPIHNTQVYLLDEAMQVVPIGVPGELFLSGHGLARGYLHRPDLTNEKFIPNPFAQEPGARLYRTGDLAVYQADGNIKYLGRLDNQAKIRGFRIELGEIESLLESHDDVRQALVMAREDRADEKLLVAYYVLREGNSVTAADLQEFVKAKLPHYMVPTAMIELTAFPLLPNGKVNRKALPAPDRNSFRPQTDRVLPQTETEQQVAQIWSQVLHLEDIGVHDDFFELGGHSLRAAQVLSLLRANFGLTLSMDEFFKQSTVAKMAELVESGERDEQPIAAIPAVAREAVMPLSFAQERMWFLQQLQSESQAYNVPTLVKLRGVLDVDVLRSSLQQLVDRHEVMRTCIRVVGNQPMQVMGTTVEAAIRLVDLSAWPEEQRDAELARLAMEESDAAFDLEQAPLFRAVLFRLSEQEHVLLFNMHHIITDGWSLQLLFQEWGDLYASAVQGEDAEQGELDLQYVDYAMWQREQMDSLQAEQLDYWRAKLETAPPFLELPADHPRPAIQTFRGSRRNFLLPRDLVNDVTKLGQQEGATLYMTLLAAFNILLARLTGESDIVVGSPVANRSRFEFEQMMGLFVNTLVLRTDFADSLTVTDVLGRVKKTVLEALAHQDVAFEKVVEELQVERDPSRNPLFQVMFALQNTEALPERWSDLELETLTLDTNTAMFDMAFIATEVEAGVRVEVDFNCDLFEPSTVERWFSHYETLLRAVVAQPSQPIARLPLLTEAERHQLLFQWNEQAPVYDGEQGAHQFFEALAVEQPDHVAVVWGDRRLTYRELNEQANRLARYLQTLGVVKESLVAISMERSLDILVAVLGVMKAGAAYVPMDPTYPEERLHYMMEDSKPSVLLTHASLQAKWADAPTQVVYYDELAAQLEQQPITNLDVPMQGQNLAYIIYTSGSTGKPKAVMVPHVGLNNVAQASAATFGLTKESRMLQFASLSFDASAWEIFMALQTGASLFLATMDNVTEVVNQHRVTAAMLPPAVLAVLDPQEVPTLRTIISGGEACSPKIVQRWAEAKFFNAYGPTEASICSTIAFCVPDGKEPPIGRAVAGARLYVLDEQQQPVPLGVPGELYIGGIGVARGYLNRPELTDERFVQDPFCAGGRMYRTGDLVKYLPDGQLTFLGRLDHQVKVRGLRIELGEIESAILSHRDLQDAVVTVAPSRTGDPMLVAYVVTEPGQTVTTSELRAHVERQLPRFMVPSAITLLDALPLTPNGKVDVRALPAPVFEEESAWKEEDAPRDAWEQQIAAIWEEILNVQHIGVHEDFFSIGGHSLRATQVNSRIRETFGVALSLADFFATPTIAGLAEKLRETSGLVQQDAAASLVEIARGEDLVLSFNQERLWFLQRLEPESAAYHIPFLIRLQGDLQADILLKALREIVKRHESLRTTFQTQGDHQVQVIQPHVELYIPVIDLREQPEGERLDQAKQIAAELSAHPFDLAQGPLLRATLVRLADAEHWLVFTIHHIVFDGWSTGVLFQELGAFYEALATNQPVALPELPYQFADYATWQREWMDANLDEQMIYWRAKMEGAVTALELPTDRPRPAVQTYRGARWQVEVPQALTDALRHMSQREGVTLFMTLLTGFKILLARLSGEEDIVVGTPIANRKSSEAEQLIGFFVNTLILRTELHGNPTFGELLRRVQETAVGAYQHQDVPFEKLVEELQPERSTSRNPLFQVMFNMINTPNMQPHIGGLQAEVLDYSEPVSKFDLTLYANEMDERLDFELVYNPDLFDEERMIAFTEQLLSILEQAVQKADVRIRDFSLVTPSAQTVLPNPALSIEEATLAPVALQLTAWAAKHPQRTAVQDGTESVTYEQLEAWSNQLAHHLISKGIGKGDVVAVYAQRSAALVLTLLGIHKAGAAFLMLDPAYPAARLNDALQLAKPRGFLQVEAAGELPAELAHWASAVHCHLILGSGGSSAPESISGQPTTAPNVEVTAADTAYIAFTSGTTGKPKGIIGTHGPLSHFMQWHVQTFGMGQDDRFGVISGLAHDPFLRDLLAPLHAGATLCIPEPDLVKDIRLRDWMIQTGVTVLHLTPAMGQLLQEGAADGSYTCLRYAFFGGEMLTRTDLLSFLKLAPNASVVNFYGATETPQGIAYHVFEPQASDAGTGEQQKARLPIGRGIDGVDLLILDQNQRLLGVGETGEVYIRTPYLSQGYLGDARNTKSKFVQNPFTGQPTDRMYRSGDLGRYLPNGEVELIGRADRQVKIRGFRIELEEIEAAISRMPDVWDTAVVVREDSQEEKRIVAYVVAPKFDGSTDDIRRFLQQHLPDYMLPSEIMMLETIPLTPNGKVDWKALPMPDFKGDVQDQAFIAPRTEMEETIVSLWSSLLGRESISMYDNFFEIGGHSLKVIRLLGQIRDQLHVDVPLRSFFEAPTVADLSAVVESLVAELEQSEDDLDDIMKELMELAGGDEEVLQQLINDMMNGQEDDEE